MNSLYGTIGISKQAVAQYARRQGVFDSRMHALVLEADELRREHPGCGVEKMYRTLSPDFIGRDRFVSTMMQLGFRLKKRKNHRRTTYASKIYCPNLIKGMEVNAPSVVWQSDITYLPVGDRHYYAVFIIDVYTKKIVGYHVGDNMRAKANVMALTMALRGHKAPKIHHSDRGSQYTYREYTEMLRDNGAKISMALSAQDNAYAERVNRTIKEEYLDHWRPINFQALKRCTKKAVKHYNEKRIHNSIGRSPVCFENYWSFLRPQKRPIITIFDNELLTENGQH